MTTANPFVLADGRTVAYSSSLNFYSFAGYIRNHLGGLRGNDFLRKCYRLHALLEDTLDPVMSSGPSRELTEMRRRVISKLIALAEGELAEVS